MSELLASLAFGRFRLSTAQRTLWVDVLAALIERRERVVPKHELLDVVWPHLVVEENNLQVQIWALRKLVGPDVIVTIPGRGYRFAAALEGDPAPVPADEISAPTVPLVARTPWSKAGVAVFDPWPTVREELRPLGERWTARFASTWTLFSGLRGDPMTSRAVLEEARGLEQPDWPAWLAARRVANGIRISHWAGEIAGEIGELPGILSRLEREGDASGRAAFMLGIHLAEDLLAWGCLDEGTARLVALAQQGRRQRRDAATMMLLFPPLILALTETDRLDDAREVVVEALPLVRRFAVRASYAPILALCAVRRGRADTGARLMAAGEVRSACSGARLELIGSLAQQKVRDLLAAAHADEQLSAWLSEGEALTDEEFVRTWNSRRDMRRRRCPWAS